MPHGAAPDDANGLAHALVPVLRHTVGDRLGDVSFFRSAWQRGGSETAFSTYRLDSGEVIPVIVKLPVNPNEYWWTTLLGGCDLARWHDADQVRGSTPRVLASGLELGGYDLAWLIVERLAGEPLGRSLDAAAVHDLLAAAADFQMLATRVASIWKSAAAARRSWTAAASSDRPKGSPASRSTINHARSYPPSSSPDAKTRGVEPLT